MKKIVQNVDDRFLFFVLRVVSSFALWLLFKLNEYKAKDLFIPENSDEHRSFSFDCDETCLVQVCDAWIHVLNSFALTNLKYQMAVRYYGGTHQNVWTLKSCRILNICEFHIFHTFLIYESCFLIRAYGVCARAPGRDHPKYAMRIKHCSFVWSHHFKKNKSHN